ncbi:MAG: fasciclin domain-containing protein [Planctomycetota bacterium]|nr:fasciclin domain-containing protein [Planctomycetota bacterium]
MMKLYEPVIALVALVGSVAACPQAKSSVCKLAAQLTSETRTMADGQVPDAAAADRASVITVSMKDGRATAATGDVIDVAKSAGSFSTLLAALEASDLLQSLRAQGPFTVFAPTDEAFAKLGKHRIEELLKPENKEALRTILLYHVVPGSVASSTIVSSPQNVATANGQRLKTSFSAGTLIVGSASVLQTDIRASNGIIHVIDTVLMPSTRNIVQSASRIGKFKTLLKAVQAAGLGEALNGTGPLTVLAPSDEAFAKLPEGVLSALLRPENREQLVSVLTYHVIPGRVYASDAIAARSAKTVQNGTVSFAFKDGAVRITDAANNQVRVGSADIDVTNGVLHVIDAVLLPPDFKLASPSEGDAMISSSPIAAIRRVIELAIDRGVPLFNQGQPEACAAIYEVAINGVLMLRGDAVPEQTRAALAQGVVEGKSVPSATDRAWAYRRALDKALETLDGH